MVEMSGPLPRAAWDSPTATLPEVGQVSFKAQFVTKISAPSHNSITGTAGSLDKIHDGERAAGRARGGGDEDAGGVG